MEVEGEIAAICQSRIRRAQSIVMPFLSKTCRTVVLSGILLSVSPETLGATSWLTATPSSGHARRYGAYVPHSKYAHKHAAAAVDFDYSYGVPYAHGYYSLPYRTRYGLYRPWYRSYYPPSYYRYHYRPWYTHPYTLTEPNTVLPAEPCYDGCYYW